VYVSNVSLQLKSGDSMKAGQIEKKNKGVPRKLEVTNLKTETFILR